LIAIIHFFLIFLSSLKLGYIRLLTKVTKLYQFQEYGTHGVDFKYIPIHQAKQQENFPRIIQIAGMYPDISPDQIFAPPTSLPAGKGSLPL
jgi:hypothetical protein